MMLPPKRKKNLKIDNNEKLEVFDITDLDTLYLEEFTLPPIDSGMEAEEEKEVHLKRIIEHKSGDIPVPVIEEIDSYLIKKQPVTPEYCKYHKDVNIDYILTDGDKYIIDSLNISEKEYLDVVNFYKNEIDGNQRISNEEYKKFDPEVYKKISEYIKFKFLLRDECPECPSYVCFRKRIQKPSRKNRRSETQATEKISRLSNELVMIIKMTELNKENSLVDDQISKVDRDIVSLISEISAKYGNKKNKIRSILNNKEHKKIQSSLSQGDAFHDIMFNRDSIRIIKRRLTGKKLFNDDEIKKEMSAYKKYLKDNTK